MILFHGIKEGFKEFGALITVLVNSILLSLVYLFGVGFSSLILKISKKRRMDAHIDQNAKTYWKDLGIKTRPMERYYRQY